MYKPEEIDQYRNRRLKIANAKAWGIALCGMLVLPITFSIFHGETFEVGFMSAITFAGGIWFALDYFKNESELIERAAKRMYKLSRNIE